MNDGVGLESGSPSPGVPPSADQPKDSAAVEKRVRLPDIPSLTGIRFFAATFVVQAHIYDRLSRQMDGGATELMGYFIGAAALGMSLFFVLSGFVIHYNYRDTILRGGPVGYWNFFVARFARLYPLYIILLLIDLGLNGMIARAFSGDSTAIETLTQTAPQYLTLTQTWTYGVVGEQSMVYQLGNVGSVAWSISTEWFFYFFYPVVCIVALWLPRAWLKFAALALFSVIVLKLLTLILAGAGEISAFGVRHYGPPAGMDGGTQDSLFRWIIYFSPYTRVSEFIVGVLICGAYLDCREKPFNVVERLTAPVLPFLALSSVAVVHVLMWMPSQPFPVLTQLHMCFGYTLPCAALIYSVARYRGPLASFLSWRPLVFVGDVSYSIYLVHLIVVGMAFQYGVVQWFPVEHGGVHLHMLVLVAAVIAVSIVTYFLIEVPARDWLRRAFSVPSTPPERKGLVVAGLLGVTRTAVLLVTLALPMAILVAKPPAILPPPGPGTIDVVSATYGANCGAPAGNVTADVIKSCNGGKSCNFVVDVAQLGDPAGGCGKDFAVAWTCADGGDDRLASIPPEAGLGGKSVDLACN